MSEPISPTPSAPRARRPRADAERNRARLLAAAQVAFTAETETEAETPVSLEAIAREAGVGIGTLYRHFPTREALVAALYRHELDELCISAGPLLVEHDPEGALRAWMERFRDYVTVKRGMGETLRTVFAAGTFDLPEIRAEMADAIAPILAAGVKTGSLREDVSAPDVVAGVVGMFAATSIAGGPEQLSRLLDLLVDATRAPTRQ